MQIRKSCTITDFDKLVGKLVCAGNAIQCGWLYIKILEADKIRALKNCNGSYKIISDKAKLDMVDRQSTQGQKDI